MTTMRPETIPAAELQREIMMPSAFDCDPLLRRGFLIRFLAAVYCDKRFNVSRPKLLFTVALADLLIVFAVGLLSTFLTHTGDPLSSMSVTRGLLVSIAIVAALHADWAYSIVALRRLSGQAEKIIKSTVLVFCMVAGSAFLLKFELFKPATAAAWMTVSISVLVVQRFIVADIIERLSAGGRLLRRTIIIGGGPDAEAVVKTLQREQEGRISILGVFDDRQDERSSDTLFGYPKLGTFEQLAAFCRNAGIDLLIVTVPQSAEERLLEIMARLFTIPVDIRISALSSKLRLNARAYTFVGSIPMLSLMDRPLSDWSRAVKNVEDRVLGTLILLLALPIMAVCALAIRFDSRGPVLFKQRRYGFNNELIEVYKFRSMYVEMTDVDASKLATRDDPRITRVGRFLRRTSLDELPQLFNVILGQMSLVGPRPHATEAKAGSDLYQAVVDGYFARHRMKPGVTGWAQINGWRGETDTHEKIQKRVEHDLYYIDHWSILFDLYIVALTPMSMLTGKNAY